MLEAVGSLLAINVESKSESESIGFPDYSRGIFVNFAIHSFTAPENGYIYCYANSNNGMSLFKLNGKHFPYETEQNMNWGYTGYFAVGAGTFLIILRKGDRLETWNGYVVGTFYPALK